MDRYHRLMDYAEKYLRPEDVPRAQLDIHDGDLREVLRKLLREVDKRWMEGRIDENEAIAIYTDLGWTLEARTRIRNELLRSGEDLPFVVMPCG